MTFPFTLRRRAADQRPEGHTDRRPVLRPAPAPMPRMRWYR